MAQPTYQQIADELRLRTESGEFEQGSRVPKEAVSRGTERQTPVTHRNRAAGASTPAPEDDDG